jgi:hypothetical protein
MPKVVLVVSTKAERATRSTVFQGNAEAIGINHSLKLQSAGGTSEPLSLVFESMLRSRRTAT